VALNLAIWFGLHVLFREVRPKTFGPLTVDIPSLSGVDIAVIGLSLLGPPQIGLGTPTFRDLQPSCAPVELALMRTIEHYRLQAARAEWAAETAKWDDVAASWRRIAQGWLDLAQTASDRESRLRPWLDHLSTDAAFHPLLSTRSITANGWRDSRDQENR
jgi:hypothetical protein